MENTDKFQESSETPIQPLRPPSYDPETAQADADVEAAARANHARQQSSEAPRPIEQAKPGPKPIPVAQAQTTPKPEPKPAVDASSPTQVGRQAAKPLAAARVAAKPKPVAGSPPAGQPEVEEKNHPRPVVATKTAPASPASATERVGEPVAANAVTEPAVPAKAPVQPKSKPEASAEAAPMTGRAVTTGAEVPPVATAPTGQPSSLGADEARLLQTRGLVKVYDGRAVVKEVDIHVRPTEIVGLLGPNGAGKTTTFYMIVGLVPPNGGRVFFNDEDVTDDPMYRRARKGMGYLPQEESIFRKLTVEQNIMAVMETLNISRSERRDRCHALMKQFGIEHIGKSLALTCSGGEKRRLTIARSLVTQPKLLMLDEPFSGVDPIAVSEIQDIIVGLRESGLAILITDHNVRETLNIVDRACLICEGKVLREGTRDFLINDPISRELYLGDRFSM